MALSSAEKKLIGRLLVMATENQRGVNVMATAMSHYTSYLYPRMARCDAIGCKDAATVRNDLLDMQTCDHCAATAIVRAMKNMTGDEDDELEPVRVAAAREDQWRDLEGAQAIRMIEEHYRLIRDGEKGTLQ